MTLWAFQMWEPMRQQWMAEHRFYIEQAKKRLLSQFANMGTEAESAAREYLETTYFDPETDDPGATYESANDREIEFYQLLSDMQERTRLGVVAGMYHEWDKNVREWLVTETRHWAPGENVRKAVWKVEVPFIFALLAAFGFDPKAISGYQRLDAMRLIVNVFKHGNGRSLDDLKTLYPEFVPGATAGHPFPLLFLDHTCIKVTDDHLEQFSAAILDFWTAIPAEMLLKKNVDVPKWFEKAYLKDRAATI